MSYEKLFSRGSIGTMDLKNRIVMTAMGTGFARYDGEATDEIIRFYEERAKGGCGLIITEITRIDEETGIGLTNQLSISSDRAIRKLTELVDAVQQHDCKIMLQLHHPGRQTASIQIGGKQAVAPSGIACKVIGEVPREMTTTECEEMVQTFVAGALRAKMAGFDGVEVHAAHGYLINQFLSPYSNQRTDKYGGDFAKRFAFLEEIILGIQKVCGIAYPIMVRISASEYTEGGLTIEDAVAISKKLETMGVAAIDVSAGTYESNYAIMEPQQLPEGWKKQLAKEVKKNVTIPVVAVNNIKRPAFAEKLLEEDVCDFIGIARGQLADPEWANKALMGNDVLIRKCLGCLHCSYSVVLSKPLQCTVNPRLGRETRYNDANLVQNGTGKKIIVVGGGPAGMQAAMVLAKRKFAVTLLEKSNALGGLVKTAEVPPHKEMLGEFIKTQLAELELHNVDVKLNVEATADIVKKLNPYGVVYAVGGESIVPNSIPGIFKDHVWTANDVLTHKVSLAEKKIAVIGAGVTGLETAEVLAEKNQVTIYERDSEIALGLNGVVKMFLLNSLAEKNVVINTNHLLKQVEDTSITVLKDNLKEITAEVDAVVLAMGVSSNKDRLKEFQNEFHHLLVVGDAQKPGQIYDALKTANDKTFAFN